MVNLESLAVNDEYPVVNQESMAVNAEYAVVNQESIVVNDGYAVVNPESQVRRLLASPRLADLRVANQGTARR